MQIVEKRKSLDFLFYKRTKLYIKSCHNVIIQLLFGRKLYDFRVVLAEPVAQIEIVNICTAKLKQRSAYKPQSLLKFKVVNAVFHSMHRIHPTSYCKYIKTKRFLSIKF